MCQYTNIDETNYFSRQTKYSHESHVQGFLHSIPQTLACTVSNTCIATVLNDKVPMHKVELS